MGTKFQASGDTIYHGTGFLAHQHIGSVYDGKPTGGVRRVVDDILENGLVPFHDPLNPDGGSTISLTSNSMYATLYALCYAEKGSSRIYFPHRERVWARMLLGIAFTIIKNRIKGTERDSMTPTVFQRHNTLDKSWRWPHTFNNADYNSPIHAFLSMIVGESNIPGNYPVVFGVKNLGSFESVPGWSEIRTKSTISPSNIAEIYIPDKYHGEYPTDSRIKSFEKFVRGLMNK